MVYHLCVDLFLSWLTTSGKEGMPGWVQKKEGWKRQKTRSYLKSVNKIPVIRSRKPAREIVGIKAKGLLKEKIVRLTKL